MGFILMQPADDEQLCEASEHLQKTGEYLFNLSLDRPFLKPLSFGSRACTDIEKNFHSFVGEAACRRWNIVKNRRYLWGGHFYWIRNSKSIKIMIY